MDQRDLPPISIGTGLLSVDSERSRSIRYFSSNSVLFFHFLMDVHVCTNMWAWSNKTQYPNTFHSTAFGLRQDSNNLAMGLNYAQKAISRLLLLKRVLTCNYSPWTLCWKTVTVDCCKQLVVLQWYLQKCINLLIFNFCFNCDNITTHCIAIAFGNMI